jgi:TRAP-type uncharacterized transport system substrate-binding protein
MKLALILALTLTTPALAEPLIIGAGKSGGGYDNAAQKLATRLSQRNTDAVVSNFNGSDEITLALCQKTADIGYSQIDAIYARGQEGCFLKPIGIYGVEYGQIWFPPKSDFDELEDLDGTARILVDTIGSGSELFWNTITDIEMGDDGSKDEWASATAVFEPIDMAPTLGSFGEIDAVIMVRKPGSNDAKFLEEQGWQQGWLYDKDINDLMFNDVPLYESDRNSASYAVRSFLVSGPNFDQTMLRKVQAANK